MKKCPFCAEEIQPEAVKCRYCGEFLNSAGPKPPWYFKTSVLVVSLLCVGPFALPLLWFNPHRKRSVKIIVSAVVLVLTYYLTVATVHSVETIKEYYSQIAGM